jgi:hypothetical protein
MKDDEGKKELVIHGLRKRWTDVREGLFLMLFSPVPVISLK